MTTELIALVLSVLYYERDRRVNPVIIPGRCVDVHNPPPPPIINLSDDRPVWLRRDRSRE